MPDATTETIPTSTNGRGAFGGDPPDRVVDDMPATAPADDHNTRLVGHVHPADWVNPTPDGPYNMVVIGGGTAGLVTAAGSAGIGAKVALIERDLLGGDCLNVGCVPSKALLAAAKAAHHARHTAAFGVHVDGGVRVDFPAVMERLRRLRADIAHHDSARRFTEEFGIDVFIGDAAFTSASTVEVGGQTLTFKKACIATGGRAAAPPIDGLAEAGYLTNETLFSLTELPARLAVIGGGPIGCEMSQAFARFGSKITLLEQQHRLLGKDDREAGELVRAALVADGIDINCCCVIKRVERQGDERVLHMECDGGAAEALRVDAVLVAVGRAPNVQTLNLDAAGVKYDPRKGVQTDDTLKTTNPNVFAAGDVGIKFKFTHTADASARIVIRNALFGLLPGKQKVSDLVVPWCTYTEPELAHVGMLAEDAEKNPGIETLRIGFDAVDRAILEGQTEGFLKVYHRKGKAEIVGATVVGPHAGDLISEVTAVMKAGGDLGTLSATIHPYPTIGEAFRKAGDAYSKTRLKPVVATLFKKYFAWRR